MEDKIMKKVLALLLSLTLVIGMFTGCGKSEDKEETETTETTTETEVEETETAEEPAEAAAAKTGLAVITSTEKSKDVSEEDGLAQVDSTVVAVLVDQDGKILDIKIDSAQTKINFSAEGKLTTDLATVFKSKQELGTEYGMGKVSTIGKEWNEQATALAEYVVGKTVEEIKGIAVTEEGAPTDADLAASVTIKIGGYVAAIEKAVSNAQDLGAKVGDTLGLGVSTDIAKSKDAAEEDGLAQAYSNYAAITFDADGKITSSLIDASQGNINFSKEGKITSDLTVAQQTKQELGDDYGMKKASTIGKEWFEQANAFAAYVVGKTVDEVKGIAVDAEGVASDADLVSSVTVHIGPYIGVIEKAAASAAK